MDRIDRITGYEQELAGLAVFFETTTLRITPVADSVLKVSWQASGSEAPPALPLSAPAPVWEVRENAAEISIFAPHLEAAVSRATGMLCFRTRSGETLVSEPPLAGRWLHREGDRVYFRQSFTLEPETAEAIYGLNIKNRLNLRGRSLALDASDPARPPLLVSTRGYGIAWAATGPSQVYPGSEQADRLTWQTEAATGIEYWLIYGPRLDRVVANYRELVGPVELPPRWRLGLQVTQPERFRERGFACEPVRAETGTTPSNPAEWQSSPAAAPASFESLRLQIQSDLNQVFSGRPFFEAEAGQGSLAAYPQGVRDPFYRELYLRGFQYAAFCPFLSIPAASDARVDENSPHLPWNLGTEVERLLQYYGRLRYCMLPYLYSIATQVHTQQSPMVRPLAMDFRRDPETWGIHDQFMLGPSLLVAPVTQAGALKRAVYLPRGRDWVDFWTGDRHAGGQTVLAAAALETIPLFVPTGSLLFFGPELNAVDECPANPIEIRIYPGGSAELNLVEDEGLGISHAEQLCSRIPIYWDERDQILRIGAREGNFPGMLEQRSFRVIWDSPGQRTVRDFTPRTDCNVRYQGDGIAVVRPRAHSQKAS